MSIDFSDQNLLFAIVMLRNGFVSESQFVSVLNQWSETKSKDVADIVVDHGILEPDDAVVITNLVRRQIQKHGNVRQSIAYHAQDSDFSSCEFSDRSIEELLQQSTLHPEDTANEISNQAEIEFTAPANAILPHVDEDFSVAGQSAAHLAKGENAGDDSANARSIASPDRDRSRAMGTPRFNVLRPHAKGGLGKVSVAMDTELDREVALKEIRKTFSGDKMARDRFCLEACITGGLEHPGVVPVYGFGKNKDGSPYFAMRLIRGETFKDAILDFHAENSSKRAIDNGQRRLQFRSLLTRFVDSCNAIAYAHNRGVLHRDIKPSNIMLGKFGETLVVDWGLAKKIGREEEYIDDDDSLVLNGSAVSGTLDGSTIGTPTFMSPEQAAGKLEEMKPASDIYSLGSTLYFLLTGKTAFTGSSAGEVVAQVRENDFMSPSERHPQVPAALNSICCKAMSTRPVDRYKTALDLAGEIESWLADERVLAHRESLFARAGRWLRHHRTLATSAAVTVLTVATASLVGMMMLNVEKNKTEAALVQVSAEKEKADDALVSETRARRQTRDVLTTVTDDLVGELMARQVELGSADKEFFGRVIKQFDEFTAHQGDSAEARNIRADGYFRVGNLHRRLNNLKEAGEAYLLAEAAWSELASEFEQVSAYQRDLASVIGNHAMVKARLGKHEAAVADKKKAVEIMERLCEKYPADNDFQIDLAELLVNRANEYSRVAQLKNAKTDYERARDILEPLTEMTNDDKVKSSYAETLSNLAGLLSNTKEGRKTAQSLYRRAIAQFRGLEGNLARQNLATAQANLGAVLEMPAQSADAYRNAIEIQSRLVDEFPSRADYKGELLRSKNGLGSALAIQNHENAEEELLAAFDLGDELVAEHFEQPGFKKEFAQTLIHLGIYYRSRDVAKAKSMYQRGVGLFGELLKDFPENRDYALQHLKANTNFANFLRLKGDPQEAAVAYQKVCETLESAETPNVGLLRKSRFGLADSLVKAKDYEAALEIWTLLAANGNDPNWAVFELQKAICMVRSGDVEKGVAVAESVLTKQEKAVVFYDVACCNSVAATIETANSNGESATVGKFQARAIELLQRAGEQGFFESEAMRENAATDGDLDSLRELPEFKSLVEKYKLRPGSEF